MCKARPGFLEGEQIKIGSDVQVEISVEVDEHVEKRVKVVIGSKIVAR